MPVMMLAIWQMQCRFSHQLWSLDLEAHTQKEILQGEIDSIDTDIHYIRIVKNCIADFAQQMEDICYNYIHDLIVITTCICVFQISALIAFYVVEL